ncbi:HAD-IIIC family phosphatase [Streptomyces sp. NRRL F-525]|uniref:HAD-IIIC family phosphatase n=1 Tax=Streptomyces sp. NRRL F-525 TaxID=1463861 RepID=UPI0005254251|nr:HAD-IIIC family phosphatase [Streptomyces sp. NRRL F-525]
MSATEAASPVPAAAPNATLLDLHRSGALVTDYPQVGGLLTDLDSSGLAHAGQLLARLDPDDVLAAHPATPVVSVAVTGHGTLATLVPALTAECARHGLLLRAHQSTFDNYVFDLTDPDSALYAVRADLTLCLLDHTVVFDAVPSPWRPEDVADAFDTKLALIEKLVARFGSAGSGTLVLNTLSLPSRYPRQLLDHRSRARLGAIWREANARLLRLAEEHTSLVVLDLDPVTADGTAATDPRLSVYAKAHLSTELLAHYARDVGHLARHVSGRTKKCLVVDLDETVWGGVLGEDGVEGIQVADSYRGEAFRQFQQAVRQIASQGVLLAAVSKNDVERVQEAFTHPRMTLAASDFVRITANWRPKHENLLELAADLNLGVDSFVFVDDSPYECNLVRRQLPGVAVVPVGTEPAQHIGKVLADGWFDSRELTTEDITRVSKYRDELVRNDFLHTFESIEDYLRELKIEVRLAEPADTEVSRISQITLRTNQFNLTTLRLQPSEVRAMRDDGDSLVLGIAAADRFGDNGLVGAIFARRTNDELHIENFLLSCRVFSRGIEHACLSALLRLARDSGLSAVCGMYRTSAKNSIVKDFYPRYGFQHFAGYGQTVVFRHSLAAIAPAPEHIHLTENLEGALQ